MYIYKDIVTGDELFTDAYKFKQENGFYIVTGKLQTRKADEVDESMIGGNASQEEVAEGLETSSQTGVDVVMDNRLVQTGFGAKKEFQNYFKDYIKQLKAAKAAKGQTYDEDAFQESLKAAFLSACASFKEWEFFQGEKASSTGEGAIVLMKWEGEPEVPVLYYFSDGIYVEKV